MAAHRQGRFPKPINSTWILEALIAAEERVGSPLVGPLTLASDLRRATVFTLVGLKVLAFQESDRGQGSHHSENAGVYLLTNRCRDLLRMAGLGVPGLLSALSRMNGEPFQKDEDYRLLMELLVDPAQKSRAKILANLNPLNSITLDAVARLDTALLSPEVASSVRSFEFTEYANNLLRFVQSRCSTVLGPNLLSLASQKHDRNGQEWARRLLVRYGDRFPASPIDGDLFFSVLNGPSMAEAATSFRNCLKSKILEAAAGSSAFFVANTTPQSLVELRRLQIEGAAHDIWVLHGVHIAQNKPVPPHIVTEVEERLLGHGIGRLRHATSPDVADVLADKLGVVDAFSYGWG